MDLKGRARGVANGAIAKVKLFEMSDEKAEISPTNIITMVVGFLLVAYLMPEALDAIYNASTSGWDSGAANIWSVLGIIAIIAVMVKIYEA